MMPHATNVPLVLTNSDQFATGTVQADFFQIMILICVIDVWMIASYASTIPTAIGVTPQDIGKEPTVSVSAQKDAGDMTILEPASLALLSARNAPIPGLAQNVLRAHIFWTDNAALFVLRECTRTTTHINVLIVLLLVSGVIPLIRIIVQAVTSDYISITIPVMKTAAILGSGMITSRKPVETVIPIVKIAQDQTTTNAKSVTPVSS